VNNYNKKNLLNNFSNINIYYFIFDGMMSLEQATKNEILLDQDKEQIISNFKKEDIIYIPESHSNYSTTYLSIHSLFDMNYILDEKSEKYSYANKEFMFPFTFIDEKNYPKVINILNNLKTKFYWIGNENQSCTNSKFIKCISSSNANVIYLLTEFYNLTPLKYILKYYKIKKEDTLIIEKPELFFENISAIIKNKNSKNKFLFFHLILPHSIKVGGERIFVYDKNCIYSQVNKLNYQNSYLCAIKTMLKIKKEIDKFDKEEKIIIFSADHGWNINEINNNEIPIVIDNELNLNRKKDIEDRAAIINFISAPKRCGLKNPKRNN
jgi:hypothetical protein